MFKGFNNRQLHGFPNLNFQGDISAYGFGGVSFWLDAAFGLNTQTNLGAVSRWQQRVGGGTFVQTSAGNQPRLILNDSNFNNFPSVQSVDSGRFMDATVGTGLKYNAQNITLAVISKVDAAIGTNWLIAQPETFTGIADGGTTGAATGFGNWLNSSVVLQGTTESTNPRIKIITATNVIINGVNERTGSAGGSFLELIRLFTSTAGFGSTQSIAEIVAFGYSMTETNAIALSNNINQKYAIY
jgi:hypothetical protein